MINRCGVPDLNETVAIVVHFNRWPAIVTTLESLYGQGLSPAQVVVVDNSAIKEAFNWATDHEPTLTWEMMPENNGYGSAVNHGLRIARARGARRALICTHEIIMEPSCLNRLAAVLDADDSIAAAGPLVIDDRTPDTVWSCGGELSRFMLWPRNIGQGDQRHYWASHQSVSCHWLEGCCFLADVGALAAVGDVDPGYFLYMEEVDLFVRLNRAGYSVRNVRHSAVRQRPGHMSTYLAIRNRVRLARRLYPTALPLILLENLAALILGPVRHPMHSTSRQRERWRGVRDGFTGRLRHE